MELWILAAVATALALMFVLPVLIVAVRPLRRRLISPYIFRTVDPDSGKMRFGRIRMC